MSDEIESIVPLPPPPMRKPTTASLPDKPAETSRNGADMPDSASARLEERFRKILGTFCEQAPSNVRSTMEGFFRHTSGTGDRSNLPITLRRHPLDPDAFVIEGRNRWMVLLQMIANASYTTYELRDARKARNEAGIAAMRELLAKRIARLEGNAKLDDYVVGGSDLQGYTLISKAQRLADLQAIERNRNHGSK
jgi:hypothetical protein